MPRGPLAPEAPWGDRRVRADSRTADLPPARSAAPTRRADAPWHDRHHTGCLADHGRGRGPGPHAEVCPDRCVRPGGTIRGCRGNPPGHPHGPRCAVAAGPSRHPGAPIRLSASGDDRRGAVHRGRDDPHDHQKSGAPRSRDRAHHRPDGPDRPLGGRGPGRGRAAGPARAIRVARGCPRDDRRHVPAAIRARTRCARTRCARTRCARTRLDQLGPRLRADRRRAGVDLQHGRDCRAAHCRAPRGARPAHHRVPRNAPLLHHPDAPKQR